MREEAPEAQDHEEGEKVRIEAHDEIRVNKASEKAIAESGAEVLGTARELKDHEMLIVRGQFVNRGHEKGTIRRLEKSLRKHNPQWKGVLLHLPSGMELKQLPAVMVESLYEALLARFDPDLYQVRAARKKAALDQAEAQEAKSHLATAEEVAQHLAQVQMQAIKEGES